MLSRVINGTQELASKMALVATMKQAAANPNTDIQALEQINHFLERLKPPESIKYHDIKSSRLVENAGDAGTT